MRMNIGRYRQSFVKGNLACGFATPFSFSLGGLQFEVLVVFFRRVPASDFFLKKWEGYHEHFDFLC